MAEYINKDKAKRLLHIEYAYAAEQLLDEIPAADVAPVVRCKDCKYYNRSELLAPNKFCFRLKHPTENRVIGYNFAPDDFCSYGEPKMDGGAENASKEM